MTLNEYQIAAGKTDNYTVEMFKHNVYALGSAGEAGEVLEKILEVRSKANEKTIRELVLEIGDASWYASRFIFALNGTNSICNTEANSFQELTEVPVCLDINTALGMGVMLSITASAIADEVKKIERDRLGRYTADSTLAVTNKCKTMLELCAKLCAAVGVTYEQCLEMNLGKLASRAARGVISGKGDNR